MKITIKISILILTILILVSCNNNTKKEKLISEKRFGFWKSKNDSVSVELELSKYKNWKDIVKHIEKIVCNDSFPKLTLKNSQLIKTVYFRNPCWKNFGCLYIRKKNVIEICNDSVIKLNKSYSLDSLENILKRNIENKGKNPSLCENPKKLLINISYDNKFDNLPKTLDRLTDAYNKITNKTDITIWLNYKHNMEVIPPPPLPNNIKVNNKE